MKHSLRKWALAASICFLLPTFSEAESGNANPTGVTGEFNGSITTGGSYDPYTGNAKRFVDDLTVTGSVGAYPLKWTRVLNTRNGQKNAPFGQAGVWGHSYQWGLWVRPLRPYHYYTDPYEGPDGVVSYPDGRTMSLRIVAAQTYEAVDDGYEVMDRLQHVGEGNYDLLMKDGGRVEFRHPQNSTLGHDLKATRILDPYGQPTLLEPDNQGRLHKIIEPAGRYLQIDYETRFYQVNWNGQVSTVYVDLIHQVKAFSGPNGQLMETVTYNYVTEILNQVKHFNLSQVSYDDGSQALYNYLPGSPITYVSGRIHTCQDVRYAGAMKNIKYQYATYADIGGPVAVGQIKAELNFTYHQVVSQVSYPAWHCCAPVVLADFQRTETRGDGRTRVFQYGSFADPLTQVHFDFKNQPSSMYYETAPNGNTLKVLTDARNNRTVIETETISGAVRAVTRGNRPPVTYAYWDDNNPYYLKTKTDQRGKVTSYTRYPVGHPNQHMIERIDYPDGGWESFTYNNYNQVLLHRMTSGGTEAFTYVRGLKETYTPPATPSDDHPSLHPTRYFYFASGPHTDRLWYAIDPLEHTTEYQYNLRGLVTKVTHHDGKYTQSDYNPDGTLKWSEDELRHKTQFEYDEYKRPTKIINPLLKETVTNYDPRNGHGPFSHTTSSVFGVTSQMDKLTQSTYDENFRPTSVTLGVGTSDVATTSSTYDPAGNVETVTAPNQQPSGPHSTTAYDDHNRKKWFTDALGRKTEWEYDDAGNMQKETRPDLKYQTWDLYDAMNRIKHTTGFLDEPTSYDYDLAGNMTMMTDAKGSQYSFAFDELNRKKSATYPTDATGTVRTETWRYDAAGNLKVYKNPEGKFKHFDYDVRNRQWRSYWNSSGESEAPDLSVGVLTETDYDDAGRVREVRTNGGETRVTYEYDAANHKLWEDQKLGSSPAHRVQTDPDDDGNRRSLSVAGAYAVTYDYTPRGQLWHIYSGSNEYFRYAYNTNGSLTKRQDILQGGDSTNFAYDVLNRVKSGEQTGQGDVPFARSNYDEYDSLNNLKSVSREEDGNRGERFDYDFANQLHAVSYSVTISPTPTATPTPGQTPTPTPTAPPMQVAPVHIEISGTFGDTLDVTMTCDTPGATIFYRVGFYQFQDPIHNGGTPGTGTSVYTAPYHVVPGLIRYFRAVAYKAGMIDSEMSELEVDNEGGSARPAPSPRTVTYNNDPINRMSVSENGAETIYTPNGLNQYTDVGGQAAQYDGNFNLSWYNGWAYFYDADKRLISATGPGGGHAEFVYDGLGRCVKRTIGAVATVLTYDEWKPVAEWTSSGTFVASNLYGPGPDEILVRYSASTGHLHYHLDAMGHVQFLLNEANEVIEKYSYDAFGQPTITDGYGHGRTATAFGNRFLFTGREYLSTLGIYDFRHRHYLPSLGRFIQTDPIGFGGDPMNLYRYCSGNPIGHSDPTGLVDLIHDGYSPLTSFGGGEWIKGSDGLSASDWNRKPQAGMDNGDGSSGGNHAPKSGGNRSGAKALASDTEGKKGHSRAHEEALVMLREEARGTKDKSGQIVFEDKTGTIVLQEGQLRRCSPTTGRYSQTDPNFPSSRKNMQKEHHRTGGVTLYIVHYHSRTGKEKESTLDDDAAMRQERAPMIFTSRELSKEGQYQMLRPGQKPQTFYDEQLDMENN